jgi:hypothetical protein
LKDKKSPDQDRGTFLFSGVQFIMYRKKNDEAGNGALMKSPLRRSVQLKQIYWAKTREKYFPVAHHRKKLNGKFS